MRERELLWFYQHKEMVEYLRNTERQREREIPGEGERKKERERERKRGREREIVGRERDRKIPSLLSSSTSESSNSIGRGFSIFSWQECFFNPSLNLLIGKKTMLDFFKVRLSFAG